MEPWLLTHLLVILVLCSLAGGFFLDILDLAHEGRILPGGELSRLRSPEVRSRAESYQRARAFPRWGHALAGTLFWVIALETGLGGRLDAFLAGLQLHGVLRGLVFFGITGLALGTLELPFALWNTFGVEARFGFNRTTLPRWIADRIKSGLMGMVAGGLVLGVLMYMVGTMGSWAWPAFLAFFLAFGLVVNTFYPTLILPLFNRLTPLPPGELRTAIEEYARKWMVPLEDVLVMDASRRSSKSNAFFAGLGHMQRIVLFDTLMKAHPADEVIAILAHEAGHWKGRHLAVKLAFSTVQAALVLWVLSWMISDPALSMALGGSTPQLHLGLLAFAMLMDPLLGLAGLLGLALNRHHEYRADAWAARTAGADAMARALMRLSGDNLSPLSPHPASVLFRHSHPSLPQRLQALTGPILPPENDPGA